jgi:hypothetical protein
LWCSVALFREIVVRRPHEFKIACLQDIRGLFPEEWNPFYAGFGNRDTDVTSYKEVGVPQGRTFIINPKGHIQKAGSTVQSSTWSSLSAINELVDAMFPALEASCRPDGGGLDAGGGSFVAAAGGAAAAALAAGSEVSGASSREGSLDLRVNSSSSITSRVLGSTTAAAAALGGSGGSSIWGAPSRLGLGAAREAKAGAEPEGPAVSSASSQTQQLQQALKQASVASLSGVGGAGGGGSFSGTLPRGTLLPPPIKVGPQREEFNDVQYWKPTLAFNIEDELMQQEAVARRSSSTGGGPDGVLRKPSSFY